MQRKSRRRGGKSAKRGPSAEPVPVIVARHRQGATTDAVLPKLNRVPIAAALGGVVSPTNEFCCDGGTAIVASAPSDWDLINKNATKSKQNHP